MKDNLESSVELPGVVGADFGRQTSRHLQYGRFQSTAPIRVDTEVLSFKVLEMTERVGKVRLSDAFLKLWCGKHQPTEELAGWLNDRGFEIVAGLDQHGGWDVRKVKTPMEFRLE
jgi:hypothetical protein